MCGRFAFFSAHEAMPALFDFDLQIAIPASYNIAPTDRAAVIRLDEENRPQVSMLQWGLVPSWANDAAMGSSMINARAETAHSKPSFRLPYKNQRCLVPADGYFEWVKTAGGKQPYYVHATDESVFCFAGLWESWSPPDGDSDIETFTILTRSANEATKKYHHRMPVIVSQAEFGEWLGGARGTAQTGPALSEPAVDKLKFRVISTQVNNVRNNSENVLYALSEQQNLDFS